MAKQDSVSRPIQVFLDTEQFLSVPERGAAAETRTSSQETTVDFHGTNLRCVRKFRRPPRHCAGNVSALHSSLTDEQPSAGHDLPAVRGAPFIRPFVLHRRRPKSRQSPVSREINFVYPWGRPTRPLRQRWRDGFLSNRIALGCRFPPDCSTLLLMTTSFRSLRILCY